MPRKRPPAQAARGKEPDDLPQPEPGWPPLPVGRLCLFGFVILVWLGLYFGDAPPLHLKQRLKSLNFLAAPDELFLMWCGGKLAYFSLFDRWPIVLLTGTILGGAWLAGQLLLHGLGLMRVLDRLERQVFAVAVGLNLLSLYALAVGLVGGLQNRWLFVVPLAGLVISNAWLWQGARDGAGQARRLSHNLDDRRWLWWLVVALPFAFVIFFGAMLPPWDYDVREYHLQTPKEWFQNGRIDFLPHNIYANMPLGSELTALWGMALVGGKDGWWWGAMAGKTVMACYSLVAAAALVAFGHRLHSLAVGVIAAVLFLSAPWIVSLAANGLNEGPVALYAVSAIFALWLAGREEHREQASRLMLLAGFCAGSAVACKYPPLLFLVVPLMIWVLWEGWANCRVGGAHQPENIVVVTAHPTWLLHATLFLVAALAACGLWFGKNAVLTNNPTYPLLYSAFDGRTRTAEKNAQWQRVHSPQPDAEGRRFTAGGFVREIAWNGWRTLWASLTIPPLVAVAWLSRGQRRFLAITALWMLFVFVAWWLFTHRLDRFLVLLLPLAALVAAIGVFAVPHPAWRAATLGLVACGAILQFPLVALHPDNRFFAPLARLRRDDRNLGEAGLRVEAAHRWLNEHAQPGERVLLLGDAEPFDLELPAVYNTCFDDCQFTRIFQGRTRAERLATLREENIAYVFCSWIHLARYRSPGNYGYTSNYPTPELMHEELVREQRLLVPIDTGGEPQLGELFKVSAD